MTRLALSERSIRRVEGWPLAAGRLVLVVIVAVSAVRLAAAPQVTASPIDLLDYYHLGEYDAVRTALGNAASGDLGIVLQALKQDAAKWIAADGSRIAPRRRLVAATFALEVARAGLENQWLRSQEILEWACDLLRKDRERSAAERTWHLAALALIEGARDMPALDLHLSHLSSRFPDEPRLLLARAFRQESEYWRLIVSITGVADAGSAGLVLPSLDTARSRPENRREADLRTGYVLLRAGRIREAVEALSRVPPADDPGQAYLAGLFVGWAYEALGRMDEAARSFRAAVEAVPGAQIATLALAVRLSAAGQRDEAETLTDDMLGRQPPVVDPWRIYGYGDLRRFPGLMGTLRAEIERR